MNKKEKLAFAVVAALAMTSGGFAFGQSVNTVSSDQVIYACVTGVNGNIVRVSNTRKTCPRGTTPIQWNAVGPRGEQGTPGIAGLKGDKGDTGPQGTSDNSPSKSTWLAGPNSQSYQFINSPTGVGLLDIDGKLWTWDGNKISGSPLDYYQEDYWKEGIYYSASNCDGETYIPHPGRGAFFGNEAFTHKQLNGGNLAFQIDEPKNVDYSSFKSFMSSSSECIELDFDSAAESIARFANHVEELEIDYRSRYWYEVFLDFSSCKITVQYMDMQSDYQFDDCFDKPSDYIVASKFWKLPYIASIWESPPLKGSDLSQYLDDRAAILMTALPSYDSIGVHFYRILSTFEVPSISAESGWQLEIR